jgi:hypothetical protein
VLASHAAELAPQAREIVGAAVSDFCARFDQDARNF